MKRNCPIPDCLCLCPDNAMMCATHWALLPAHLQKELSRTFKAHQGDSMQHQAGIELAVRVLKRGVNGKAIKKL
jgi:hypothetical protein